MSKREVVAVVRVIMSVEAGSRVLGHKRGWVSSAGLQPWRGRSVTNLGRRLGATSNRAFSPPLTTDDCISRPPNDAAESRGNTTMSPTQQGDAADSITSQDPGRDEPKKAKSRRPPSEPNLDMMPTARKMTAMLMAYRYCF